MSEKKPNYSIVIFSVGFFGLLSQTLLFRNFLAVFEGNEISTGLFFSSWLLWISIGAFAGRLSWLNRKAVKIYEFLPLMYIPAFLLQSKLLFDARELLGASEYELIPFWKITLTVSLFNSPLSLLTGFLFVSGAEWIKNTALPTGRIYILDALGSFAGALTVTILLYAGICNESLFLAAAILPGIVPLLHKGGKKISRKRKYALGGAVLVSLIFGVLLVSNVGWLRHECLARKQWHRMLPEGKFGGIFNTPQAEYYYGAYRGEFSVIRWNSICESLPNREAAWAMAAENLAEKPDARRIMITGSGAFVLCRSLCKIPEIEKVVWLDSDPDYPSTLRRVVTEKYRKDLDKLFTPKKDIRAYLTDSGEKFDLIINMLPAPSALSLNRYYSADFYNLLSKSLLPGGVLSIGFPGGENFMGRELKMIGASLLKTLSGQFKHIVLKPGTSSRFFASDADGLSIEPEKLEKRLNRIKVLARNFPPSNIYTLFDPFRAKFQKEMYLEAIKEFKEQLINSDEQPVTSRFAMLFALKKSGFGAALPETGISPRMLLYLFWGGIIIFIILRLGIQAVLNFKTTQSCSSDCRISSADIMFFVWITSVMGMSANILLIYIFQVKYGSIFLYFGMVSALFMLGLFAGGQASARFFPGREKYLFALFSLIFIVLFGIMRLSTLNFANIFLLCLAFTATGFACGLWLPGAAKVLQSRNWRERNTAWMLWLFDSLGGALGGLLGALLLLPLFGALRTLDIFLLISIMLLVLSLFLKSKCEPSPKVLLIPLIFCFTVFSAGAGNLNKEADALKPRRASLIEEKAVFNGKSIIYYKVKIPGRNDGYIFNSADLVKGIKGYRGELELLIYTDNKGELLNFSILKHRETPYYFKKVKARKKELLKKNIFDGRTSFKTDAVTGATYSSKALTKTLNAAGKAFKSLLTGKHKVIESAEDTPPPQGKARDIDKEEYKKLISQNKLSSRKAMYYKKVK